MTAGVVALYGIGALFIVLGAASMASERVARVVFPWWFLVGAVGSVVLLCQTGWFG